MSSVRAVRTERAVRAVLPLLPLLAVLAVLLPVAAVTGCGETAEQAASDGGLPDAGDQLCGVDANNDRQGAVELVPGEAVSEFICTRNDVDWYRFILPPGQPILEVRLSNQVELTPVTYRYALLDAAGRQVPGVEGQDPRRGRGRVQLADRHHVPVAGVYYLVVRDENGVEVDRFNPYTLSISLAPDPDPFEPAERPEERADAILLGAGAQGRFLSHGGDVDWFAIEARAGELLRVLLRTAERAEIRPRYRLFTADGTTPFAGARVEPPEGEPGGGWRTERVHAVPAAGRILIEVADEESLRGDLDAGYALEASTLPEADLLEGTGRNDRPVSAVALGEGGAGGEVAGGRLGSLGDVDWFTVHPPGETGMEQPRRLELELSFSAPPLAAGGALRPTLALIQSHAPSPCSADGDCALLAGIACNHDAECPGAACVVGQHRCEGAGYCLPTQRCGVRLWSASLPQEEEQPPRLHTMAPLLSAEPLYLVLGDLQDDDHQQPGDPSSYRLAARVLAEPDAGENDGIWFPWGSSDESEARAVSSRRARHVGAAEVLRDPQSGELIELRYPLLTGHISFAGDQDWYLFEIPREIDSAVADWQIVGHYDGGGSALSLAWTIYRGRQLEPHAGWIGGFEHIPRRGTWGDNECCYLCHLLPRPLWLRVAEDLPRTGWDDAHPYSLTLRLVPGCPEAICPCDFECPR